MRDQIVNWKNDLGSKNNLKQDHKNKPFAGLSPDLTVKLCLIVLLIAANPDRAVGAVCGRLT